MAKEIATISISKEIKSNAQKASIQVFGRVNLSGYLQVLIDKDCRERNIK
jgi:hypothetical protein